MILVIDLEREEEVMNEKKLRITLRYLLGAQCRKLRTERQEALFLAREEIREEIKEVEEIIEWLDWE